MQFCRSGSSQRRHVRESRGSGGGGGDGIGGVSAGEGGAGGGEGGADRHGTRARKWMFYEALNIYFPGVSIRRVY